MRFPLFLLATAALAGAIIAQQPAEPAPTIAPAAKPLPPGANEPLAEGEGRAVAEKLAAELELNFVYPEQARRYSAMLRSNLATGRYDQGTRIELARKMTDDLQSVAKDGHLKVQLREPESQPGGAGGPPKDWPPLIQSAKEIAPGVAYIRFTAFLGTDEEVDAVRKFMADNVNAKSIIFDLRNHHGGGIEEQDIIFSYLFGKPTPLVRMAIAKSIRDERGFPFGDRKTMTLAEEGGKVVATHSALPGETTPLRQAAVYLLVSNATASAAEHFSLAFKSTGRGTLIGEATAGANHFGGPTPLSDNFAVWLPVGRTYDIETGKDWEGTGVAPDVEVDPKQALVVALEKAGLSREEAVRLDATETPAEPVHRDRSRRR